ncbi:hypothetical protein TNIN_400801, partial [Trichonephila inaurata madagascariensis]
DISLAALFLAAKVHDEHRKLEEIIKAGHFLSGAGHMDVQSENFEFYLDRGLHGESELGFMCRFLTDHGVTRKVGLKIWKKLKEGIEGTRTFKTVTTKNNMNYNCEIGWQYRGGQPEKSLSNASLEECPMLESDILCTIYALITVIGFWNSVSSHGFLVGCAFRGRGTHESFSICTTVKCG